MLTDEICNVQKIELQIMQEIDRICRKFNIEYFIIGGTLLGAVRHKGFIPWDDDFDIGMTIDNYKKFAEYALKYLGEDFYYQALEDESDYSLPCAKVRIRGTRVIEKFSKKVNVENGIWVDIFCYDLVPYKTANSKVYNTCLRLAARVNLIKHNYSPSVLTAKKTSKVVNKLLKYFPISKMKAKMLFENLLSKRICQNNKNAVFVERDNMFWGKFVFSYDIIFPLKMIVFENRMFPCPNKPEEYLKQAYGDYMVLPPLEKRKGHMVEQVYINDEILNRMR